MIVIANFLRKCAILSLALWAQEAYRLVRGAQDERMTVLLVSLGFCVALSGGVLFVSTSIIGMAYQAWPQLKERSSLRLLSLGALLVLGGFGVTLATQSAVEWASRHFRKVEYQGLFAGLIASLTALSCLIISPLLIRLCRCFTHLKWMKRVATFQERYTPIMRGGALVFLMIGGIYAQDLVVSLSPHLASVDLRAPQVILWGGLALLAGRYLLRPTDQYSKMQSGFISLFLVSALIGGGTLGYHLTPEAAWRLKRDSALASLLLTQLQKLSDQDRDGVSARWGGGDCDDRNPQVSPLMLQRGDALASGCTSLPAPDNSTSVQSDSSSELTGPPLSGLGTIESPKNILLLTIDALRYDAYLNHMPELRQFASRSVDFERAYSAGAATYWSIPALLGSKAPSAIKMGRDQTPVNEERLLTEALRDQRFHTGLFANVTIFFVRGLSQGALTKNYDTSKHTIHGERPGSAHLTNGLIKHLDAWRQGKLRPQRDRFFLWGHYYDPHEPYFEVEGFPPHSNTAQDRYHGIIRSVDHELGRLFKALETRGLLKETMVVITADHGEEFGDHGHRFHGKTLYDEMVHVPLIIYSPEYPPQRSKEVISHLDVAPTILQHLGVRAEPQFTGESWDSSLRLGRSLTGRYAFFEVLPDSNYSRYLIGAQSQDEKLIYHLNSGALERFFVRDDPLELNNRAGAQIAHQPTLALHALRRYVTDHLKRRR